MPVLVDDSCKAVVSAYREVFDAVGLNAFGVGSQRCCGGERSVGSVQVVVPLVLAQRAPEMGLVPDQHAVQQLGAQRLGTSNKVVGWPVAGSR
jgi:hypothetical protein